MSTLSPETTWLVGTMMALGAVVDAGVISRKTAGVKL
jgi:hypothetical protein